MHYYNFYFIKYSFRNRTLAFVYNFRVFNNKTSFAFKEKKYLKKLIKVHEFFEVIHGLGLDYIPCKVIYDGRNFLIPDLNKICWAELLSLQLEKQNKRENET
jgi:hypothetical protein